LGIAYDLMIEELEQNGRGRVFDVVLEKYNLKTKKNILNCVWKYRTHVPDIQLSKSTIKCFQRFSNYPKYIVTDGNKVAQHNKVKALQLYTQVKKVFISRRFGIANEKPSPYCFLKIAKLEKVDHNKVVYIGDNPNKDFVGIKPLGFKTIRILKGNYKTVVKPEKYNAAIEINSLDELTIPLLKRISLS